jgi:hypothetical protein
VGINSVGSIWAWCSWWVLCPAEVQGGVWSQNNKIDLWRYWWWQFEPAQVHWKEGWNEKQCKKSKSHANNSYVRRDGVSGDMVRLVDIPTGKIEKDNYPLDPKEG